MLVTAFLRAVVAVHDSLATPAAITHIIGPHFCAAKPKNGKIPTINTIRSVTPSLLLFQYCHHAVDHTTVTRLCKIANWQ